MSRPPSRALMIDDPVAARDACQVARPPASSEADGQLRRVPVSLIHPNASQPRQHFDEKALSALADSIRERGVLQPIIVRPTPSGEFEIVAGERRWRAAQQAGHSTIPALIDGSLDAPDALELALIENVVREDLTPIEEARTISLLLEDLKITATRARPASMSTRFTPSERTSSPSWRVSPNCGSVSTTSTGPSWRASSTARFAAVVVFPTPPFC